MKMIMNTSPHIRSKNSTRRIMLDVCIALLPALAVSVFHYGFRTLLLTAVSVAFSVALELLWDVILKKKISIGDLSAVVTGMLVAFNVPPTLPVWQLLIGDLAAIILAKMLFGGLGCNFMNPALVGRIVMMFSYPAGMTNVSAPLRTFSGLFGIASDAVSGATPLSTPSMLSGNNVFALLFGDYAGAIGETCVVALLIGAVYLLIRRVIKPIIPFTYIGATYLFSLAFGVQSPALSLLAGGLVLGAFYMATDYVTSPITNWGKFIFGLFLGLVTALIRAFGNYPEGVTFAIILGNILVPFINDLTKLRPIGAEKVRKEGKKS